VRPGGDQQTEDPGLLTETYGAGLHGLAAVMRSGRLPERAHEERPALLIGHLTAGGRPL